MKYIMQLRYAAKRGTIALLAMALAGSVMTLAVSAHGGDVTVIHACVKMGKSEDAKGGATGENERDDKGGGTRGLIRIVGADGACKRNEIALDWNIQGPPGP